jgi:hypothetical protein
VAIGFRPRAQRRLSFVMARLGLAIHEFPSATLSRLKRTRGSQGQALG